MIVRPYGADALLAEPDDPATVLPLATAARALAGVVEVVPGARTLLVAAGPAALPGIATALRALDVETVPPDPGPSIVLDVHYDGPDLAAAARDLGLSPDALVARHAAGDYVVAFCGFTPGFAYLTGLDPALHLPRRPEPRTRVPAGAVGVAGEFTGVYPRPSPGGWRLLGRTDAPLWDPGRTPPALLTPGARVRFRPA